MGRGIVAIRCFVNICFNICLLLGWPFFMLIHALNFYKKDSDRIKNSVCGLIGLGGILVMMLSRSRSVERWLPIFLCGVGIYILGFVLYAIWIYYELPNRRIA